MDKQRIRERVWEALEACGEARFPFPPHNRIPNFAGADAAAGRLADQQCWTGAETIKANPDAPQRPVRRRALEAGKVVFVAVPRLRDAACFLRLDPQRIEAVDEATTIRGAADVGEPTHPEAVEPIDLVLSGSVAVDSGGVRIGKGEGYSDLEYAILREFDLVRPSTPVATTIHELQLLEERLEPEPHDVPVDVIGTPERAVETTPRFDPPAGIDWSLLDEEDRREKPILAELWGSRD